MFTFSPVCRYGEQAVCVETMAEAGGVGGGGSLDALAQGFLSAGFLVSEVSEFWTVFPGCNCVSVCIYARNCY